MVQIRIDTQRVRDVGRQFRSDSDQINDIDNALQSAINSLDTWAWDGHSRADAEPMLDQIHPASRQLTDELERLGQLLERVANDFEQTDNDVIAFSLPPVDPVEQFLDSLTPEAVLGTISGFFAKIFDNAMSEFLKFILPSDLEGTEFFTFKGEAGAVIPLGELGIPFSGYLNGENGLTIKRNDDGTYSVIIGDAGSVGADLSQGKKLGAQVGLRGEGGYEFMFDPRKGGDLSKMGWLLTTLAGSKVLSAVGIPGLDKMTQGFNAGMLKENLISVSGGIGLESSFEAKIAGQGLEIEGTAMLGTEMRRRDLNDNSWDAVTSFKFTDTAKGKIDVLKVLQAEGELGYELTFNQITDTQTKGVSTEVVLEIQASAGGELNWKKLTGILPKGAKLESLGEATGKLKITYTLDSSVGEAMNAVTSGDFDTIVNNSSIDVSVSTGLKATTTIGGEIKKTIAPLQTIGGKAIAEISSGRELEISL